MKKKGRSLLYAAPVLALSLALLSPKESLAVSNADYCVVPPFISGAINPNLLLMIDNSASMYDLRYQDTTHTYCGNSATTACSSDTTCKNLGGATCNQAGATVSITTYSPKPCTSNDNCPVNGTKCSSGFCTKCDTTNGNANCVSSTTTSFQPKSCTADTDCSTGTNAVTNDTCNNHCNVPHLCFDTTYSNSQTYAGYFTPTDTYSYDFTNNRFTGGATMPSSCTYSAGLTKYVCVNTSGTPETVVTTGSGFTASGNFLNWLTTSKFDVEKQYLTGGKYDPTNSELIAESRGCAGRKFIKSLPGTSLTFAVRGGSPGGISSTQSLATEYGQTYLEIYTGTYNASACVSAMNDWSNMDTVSLGPFQNDTKGCVGSGNGVVNGSSVWNHILHNCYQGNTAGSQGYGTNLNALEGECSSIYGTLSPSSITDPNSGSAICSSVLSYVDASNNVQTGYLGKCYDPDSKTFSSPCDATQMQNYCTVNVSTSPVVDPPSSTSAATVAVPGFIMEQGLMNTVQVGTLTVKIAQATPPTGLVNKYADRIRFGVMSFQNNGSGSECGSGSLLCNKVCSVTKTRVCYLDSDCPSGESCGSLAKTDGGYINTYVGTGYCSSTTTTSCTVNSDCPSGESCTPSIGSHSSGLVKAIDGITASSWTPLAESFYNAIGYLARSNDYGTNPPTSRSDANFSQLASPNTATNYNANKNPSQFKCQRNNVLMITDGASTADLNSSSESLAQLYATQVPAPSNVYGACPNYSGSKSLANLAWVAKNRNIKTLATSGTASSAAPHYASESISTYVVYTGGSAGSQSGLCDPYALMNNTATNGGTTMYEAGSDPTALYDQLDKALADVAAQTSSGTAASILSNSEGSGANIVQAVFYPEKAFLNNTYANWIGEMQNLWYYVDPMVNNSSIREDTDQDKSLNLLSDNVTSLSFDSSTNTTWAYVSQDTDGNGTGDTTPTREDADMVKSIWRAGAQLWERTTPRTVYTTLDGTSLINFNTGNATSLAPYLNVAETTSNPGATNLINYTLGADLDGFRSRSVTRTDSLGNEQTRPWRLGDIISSTPRIQSNVRLNSYGIVSPGGYSDASYNSFINSNDYHNRGMVYVGANDGMLHAFNLGILDVTASGYTKAHLSDVPGSAGLGQEQWAFIPRQELPYLQYYGNSPYQHIYSVDGPTLVLDVSIGVNGTNSCTATSYDTCSKYTSVVDANNNLDDSVNTWRTVLIGGTGLGGASGCGTTNCVPTPIANPSGTGRLGYSSYFALDVTDPLHPQLLWEFSDPALGYATTGPAIVRVGDPLKNGRWYAVFGSGPTGPIDKSTNQFGGNSDQELKFFVVDIATGDVHTINTGITNAFAGSMIGGSIDADRWNPGVTGNYKDDAIYVGYVKKSGETWTDGGVGRIVTNETTVDDSQHPWTFSKVIDGIGPVTGAIARLQDRKNHNLWLYFGTGRYYNRSGTTIDDFSSRRAIFGIKEPCYNTSNKPGDRLDNSCSATVAASDLTDQSGTTSTTLAPAGSIGTGWFVTLDASNDGFGAERIVSDVVALTNGTIFATSFEPTADPCNYGGNSFLWALQYDSGNRPPNAALAGKALIQLSTGEFRQVDLAQAFGAGAARLMRRTSAAMTGKPPADAFPVVSKSANKPVKKILHIQER